MWFFQVYCPPHFAGLSTRPSTFAEFAVYGFAAPVEVNTRSFVKIHDVFQTNFDCDSDCWFEYVLSCFVNIFDFPTQNLGLKI